MLKSRCHRGYGIRRLTREGLELIDLGAKVLCPGDALFERTTQAKQARTEPDEPERACEETAYL